MLRTLKFASLFVAVLALLSAPAHAAPITGTLDIFGSVRVGATTIDWVTLPGGGQFTVAPTSDGTFAAFVNTNGNAQNLDVTTEPVGTMFPPLVGFLTLPGISFDLNFIDKGSGSAAACALAPAPGQVCTPAFPPPNGSPFTMTNLGTTTVTGSTVSLSLRGTILGPGETVPQNWMGTYTAQFTVPYQVVLSTVSGGGTVSRSYSASFHAEVIPEPSSMALALGGLLLVGGALGRKLLAR